MVYNFILILVITVMNINIGVGGKWFLGNRGSWKLWSCHEILDSLVMRHQVYYLHVSS